MKFQLLIFIIWLIIHGIIASSKEQPDRVSNNKVQTEKEYKLNLSHLGNKIYGLPDKESGKRVSAWHKNLGINPEELGTYIEGDILFSTPTEKSGFAADFFRWPGGIIPYQITGWFSATDRQVIMAAMNDFHKYTCVRFVPQTNEYPYIRITSSWNGCYSSVGHTGYVYDLNLQTPGCTTQKGTVIHELMHAAGFLHEQSRSDRDKHISILWGNIQPKYLSNFFTYKEEDLDDFGVPYDYSSVMHYSRFAFTGNGQQTIIPTPYHNYELGQREGFSAYDIEKVNRMYQCKKGQREGRKEKKIVNKLKPKNPEIKEKLPGFRYYYCVGGHCWRM